MIENTFCISISVWYEDLNKIITVTVITDNDKLITFDNQTLYLYYCHVIF